jgi:hypothetical protein
MQEDAESEPVSSTTIIVQGMITAVTAAKVMSDIDLLGFQNRYDYLYLPQDKRGIKGYAFINFVTPEDGSRFVETIKAVREAPNSAPPGVEHLIKPGSVLPARIQGVDANLLNLWSVWRGLSPVHDNRPLVRRNGDMVATLPWEILGPKNSPVGCRPPVHRTLCVRGVPNKMSAVDLMEIIDGLGLEGLYDYFFLPCDIRSLCNRGYAFISLISDEAAALFSRVMHAYTFPDSKSMKSVRVSIAKYQGVAANLERCQSVFYGGLLYYPWVMVKGEMKCLVNKEQVNAYLASLENDETASVSTESGSSVANTSEDSPAQTCVA